MTESEHKIEQLTDGWYRKLVQRKSGVAAGKYDIYVFSPDGKKFRSRVELANHCEKEKRTLPVDSFFNISGTPKRAIKAPASTSKKPKLAQQSRVGSPAGSKGTLKVKMNFASRGPKNAGGDSSIVKRLAAKKIKQVKKNKAAPKAKEKGRPRGRPPKGGTPSAKRAPGKSAAAARPKKSGISGKGKQQRFKKSGNVNGTETAAKREREHSIDKELAIIKQSFEGEGPTASGLVEEPAPKKRRSSAVEAEKVGAVFDFGPPEVKNIFTETEVEGRRRTSVPKRFMDDEIEVASRKERKEAASTSQGPKSTGTTKKAAAKVARKVAVMNAPKKSKKPGAPLGKPKKRARKKVAEQLSTADGTILNIGASVTNGTLSSAAVAKQKIPGEYSAVKAQALEFRAKTMARWQEKELTPGTAESGGIVPQVVPQGNELPLGKGIFDGTLTYTIPAPQEVLPPAGNVSFSSSFGDRNRNARRPSTESPLNYAFASRAVPQISGNSRLDTSPFVRLKEETPRSMFGQAEMRSPHQSSPIYGSGTAGVNLMPNRHTQLPKYTQPLMAKQPKPNQQTVVGFGDRTAISAIRQQDKYGRPSNAALQSPQAVFQQHNRQYQPTKQQPKPSTPRETSSGAAGTSGSASAGSGDEGLRKSSRPRKPTFKIMHMNDLADNEDDIGDEDDFSPPRGSMRMETMGDDGSFPRTSSQGFGESGANYPKERSADFDRRHQGGVGDSFSSSYNRRDVQQEAYNSNNRKLFFGGQQAQLTPAHKVPPLKLRRHVVPSASANILQKSSAQSEASRGTPTGHASGARFQQHGATGKYPTAHSQQVEEKEVVICPPPSADHPYACAKLPSVEKAVAQMMPVIGDGGGDSTALILAPKRVVQGGDFASSAESLQSPQSEVKKPLGMAPYVGGSWHNPTMLEMKLRQPPLTASGQIHQPLQLAAAAIRQLQPKTSLSAPREEAAIVGNAGTGVTSAGLIVMTSSDSASLNLLPAAAECPPLCLMEDDVPERSGIAVGEESAGRADQKILTTSVEGFASPEKDVSEKEVSFQKSTISEEEDEGMEGNDKAEGIGGERETDPKEAFVAEQSREKKEEESSGTGEEKEVDKVALVREYTQRELEEIIESLNREGSGVVEGEGRREETDSEPDDREEKSTKIETERAEEGKEKILDSDELAKNLESSTGAGNEEEGGREESSKERDASVKSSQPEHEERMDSKDGDEDFGQREGADDVNDSSVSLEIDDDESEKRKIECDEESLD